MLMLATLYLLVTIFAPIGAAVVVAIVVWDDEVAPRRLTCEGHGGKCQGCWKYSDDTRHALSHSQDTGANRFVSQNWLSCHEL
jgi:hypothetical protein